MRVLILIKHNQLDQSVVNFSSSLFEGTDTQIHLLNIVPTNGEIPLQINGRVLDFCTEFDLSAYIKQTENNLDYLNSIKHPLVVARNSYAGNKMSILKDYIQTNQIDIIVGGAHKTTVMEDAFVKTYPSRIIANTTLPYLTIKCNRDNFSPERIALIGDFTIPSKENFDVIKTIAKRHESEITLIKIQTPNDKRPDADIKQVMQAFAEMNGLNATLKIIKSADKESGVSELHTDGFTDLIVVARRTKATFFSLFNHHTDQENIVNHIYAPLLIC
ncbi:MAG: hypothetical protein GQ574_01015 [Crocinitomix sp.]|nr:hypothetical protein [Crocinitomix sp.]